MSGQERFIHRLIAWRLPLMLLAVGLATIAYPAAEQLQFDRSIENFFAPGDPLLTPYRKLERTFAGNETVLAVYADDHLFDPDGRALRRLTKVSDALAAVPGVRATISIDQPLGDEILQHGNPQADRLRRLFEGYTHSVPGDVAGIVCLLEPKETTAARETTIEQLRQTIHRQPGGMIAGVPVMIHDGFRYVEADGTRLGWTSTILLGLVITLSFRSIRWVIVPIAVVQWALLLTRATLTWSGMRLSMVSSMLTAIVTVVGIATVIHIIVRYRESRERQQSPRRSLFIAGTILAAPIFWSCATDAAGFGSLTMAAVNPIRDFGLMMSFGALLVMVGVALLVPWLALTCRPDAGGPRRTWGEDALQSQLHRVAAFVRRRPRSVGIAAAMATLVAAAGIYRLDVETDFTRNFRATSPIARSYGFIESRMGGVGMWDVVLPAPEKLDWDFLLRIDQLESRLRREVIAMDAGGTPRPALTSVVSLADMIVAAAPRDLALARSSVLRNALISAGLRLFEKKMPAVIEFLHGEDPQRPGQFCFRVLLRSEERQSSAHKKAVIAQVERISREEFPADGESPGAEVTGMYVLLTFLIDSIIRDQWITFAVATAAIAVMMLVAFRSPALALMALLPNVAPVLVVMGLMGWIGLKINVGTAMIAAVSIGLSIDSSVHYITGFRRARRAGATASAAIDSVQQSVGRAVVFATVALIIGFLSLVLSQFIPTIYFGVLVSLTMLGGLLGNLAILPLLLSLLPDSQPGNPTPAP
ncbi:MAG: MMPL family transporter [Rhodopirellula sp.]|nr:MMPL family transporter [Rhodopirellula sp.]